MKSPHGPRARPLSWFASAGLMAGLAGGAACSAQTDEIQVYTAEIAAPGELTLTLHNNYTPEGRTTPGFPGAFAPDRVLNGVPEFGYGVTDWMEAGLYLPVYSVLPGGHFYVESAKLRALFVVPHAHERHFFYGVNFEFSRNAARWEDRSPTGEVRPIIGARSGPFDFIVNPILDTGFDGLKRLDFAPSERVAYNVSDKWAAAVEHYADYGEVRRLDRGGDQFQEVFLVLDYSGKTGVEFGVGHGVTGVSDRWTIKLMFDWSLIAPKHEKP